MKRFVLGVTGASGAVYAARLLEVLGQSADEIHLVVSPAGAAVIEQELGARLDPYDFDWQAFVAAGRRWLDAAQPNRPAPPKVETTAASMLVWRPDDLTAPIASGSFLTDAMAICPCSGGTLAAVATSASGNLIQRAAEVHLKERRKLILTPRETPLSPGQIENLQRATRYGAIVAPASPGFYHGATGAADLVDFVVARLCDQLGVPSELIARWGESLKT